MNFSTFLTSESGAVTVDWVVLSAAMVGLGLAATATVRSG
ncbi:MAG: pilus assembly protein, partial [Pseudomonadota bacterium]